MFSAMWNNFYNSIRNLPEVTKGLIIFVIIMGAFVSFIYAVKGSPKGKMIGNWFLFFISILFTIVGVVFSIIM